MGAEFCQRAAKAAIRDAIAAEELKVGDDAMDAEGQTEISRKHFEEAFAGARRSVASNDLAKYDQFRKNSILCTRTKLAVTACTLTGQTDQQSKHRQGRVLLLMMMTTCMPELQSQEWH